MMSFQKIYSPMQLANAMKLVRQQNGWTQSELAKKIGIKQATISNFENNPNNTSLGATDGHAKNFSVFIQAGGSYRLTPFYDIISAFPVLGGTGIHISDLKLAMGLNASKGKKTAIDKIYPRHFLATAKVLKFPEVQMHEILSDFARMIPAALDNVKTSLPTDFPENVVTAVETNVLRLHGRLSREYGIK